MTGKIDDATRKAMAEVKQNASWQKSYSGRIIGGPMAGKSFTCERNTFLVPERSAIPPSFNMRPPRVAPLPERQEYTHRIIFGLQLWVPTHWTELDLMAELVTNYRPSP